MKNTAFLIVSSLASLLLVISCPAPMPGGEEGSLTVAFNATSLPNRSILPDIDMNPAGYVITGSGPVGAGFQVETTGLSVTVNQLAFGTWTVAVEALNASGIVIGRGEGSVVVHTGQSASLTVIVRPLDGYGTLDLTVNWNAADTDNPSIDATLTPYLGGTQVLDFTITNGNQGRYHNESVQTGYHTLIVKLLDNGLLTMGAVEVVRIVRGGTSTGVFNFTEINRPGGNIVVDITPDMAEPLEVSISGQASELPQSQAMTVSASVANDPGNVVCVWYVNGDAIGTGRTITFGNTLAVGVYRLDATAFTADGRRAGSASTLFRIISGIPSQASFRLPDFDFTAFDVSNDGRVLAAGWKDGSIIVVCFNADGTVRTPAYVIHNYDTSIYTTFFGIDLARSRTSGLTAVTWNYGDFPSPDVDWRTWAAFLDADGNLISPTSPLDEEAGPGINRPAAVRMSDSGVSAFFYEAQSFGAYRLVICNPDGTRRTAIDVGRGFLTNGALGRALGMNRATGEIIVAGESWALSYPTRRYYQRFTQDGAPIDPALVVVPELDLISGPWSNYLLLDYNDEGQVAFACDLGYTDGEQHRVVFFSPAMQVSAAPPPYGDVYFTNDRILAASNGDFIVPINDAPNSVRQRYTRNGQLVSASDQGGYMRMDGANNIYFLNEAEDVIYKNPFPL